MSDGRPDRAPAALLVDPLADEFDLDLRLGELTTWSAIALGAVIEDAQTDGDGCVPTAGKGAGTTCNTADATCVGTCTGIATCPHTVCDTCQTTCDGLHTCPATDCGATCGNTCPQTECGQTCETCAFTCATCENSCTPPCLTEGIQNTCDLMFSCQCLARR